MPRRLITAYATSAAFLALTLSACSTTSQYTSGADYLRAYDDSPAYSSALPGGAHIDAQVRAIAAIEPNLRFPARIGLARIEGGRLVSVPADEAQSWADFSDQLGADYGALIPVSPLIAAMVNDGGQNYDTKGIVNSIRRAGARQHLDHVLIYEVASVNDRTSNALRVADLTVLGLFVLPSRTVKIDTSATAMLIDVRNGYPYGSATAFASKDSAVSYAGADSKRLALTDATRLKAVDALTDEAVIFMKELRVKSLEAKIAQRETAAP